jgi:hypothetical protein
MHDFAAEEQFNCEAYSSALISQGLSPEDARAVVSHARRQVFVEVPAARTEEPPLLLPYVHSRRTELGRAVVNDLYGDLIAWQARGPMPGLSRGVWECLWGAGCPADHVWTLVLDCFKDPQTGAQDWALVSEQQAREKARTYVELSFPRTSGPWSGYGCSAALEAIYERLSLFVEQGYAVSAVFLGYLLRARLACSTAVLEQVDREAPLPSDVQLALSLADVGEVLPFGNVDLPEQVDVAAVLAWVVRLRTGVAQKVFVRDPAGDRFVTLAEGPTQIQALRRNIPAAPVRSETIAVVNSAASWIVEFSFDELLERKLVMDPLRWLRLVVSERLR